MQSIEDAIASTQRTLRAIYPQLNTVPELEQRVTFLTTQELEDRYPDKTPKERENVAAREYRTVFLMQIGGALKSGKPHDGRAPDYDDWTLNGDLLVYNEVLDSAFELSSMGIRVDPAALDRQLTAAITGAACPSTGCCSTASCPLPSAAASGSPVCVCS